MVLYWFVLYVMLFLNVSIQALGEAAVLMTLFLNVTTEVISLLFLNAPVETVVLYWFVLYVMFLNVSIQALGETPVLVTLLLNVPIRVFGFLIQLGLLLQVKLVLLLLQKVPVVFVLLLVTQFPFLFYLL
jgi:hypothetical protein